MHDTLFTVPGRAAIARSDGADPAADAELAMLALIAAMTVAFVAGVAGPALATGAVLVAALATLALARALTARWAQVTMLSSWIGALYVAVGEGAGGEALLLAAAPAALAIRFGAPALAVEAATFAALAFLLAGLNAAGAADPMAGPLCALLVSVWLLSRGAFAAAPDAAVTATPTFTLDAAARLTGATPLALRRLGVSRRAAIGRPLSAVLNAPDLAEALLLARTGAPGRALLEAGGETFEIELRGAGAGFVGVVHPVSRWIAEVEVARARHAARSRQLAELSHELRTPLTHILGFSDIMERELFGPLGERYKEYVGLIRASGRNLLDLIGGLMDLSRLEAGRYPMEAERFDIREIALEVVRLNRETAERRGLSLVAELPEAAVPVDADPRAMRQILMNLTVNALKFTPAGGQVRVRAYAGDGQLTLEVEDDGPGIPEAERERISEAFTRGPGVQGIEGVGLGLALVRGFAEQHGGRFMALAAPGGGALMRVTAPVLAPPA